MERTFWLERWQRQQIGFHQQEINSHLQAFWPQLAVPRDAQVFVPLAGKSRDMLWLCDQGHQVLGIELSRVAVAALFSDNDLQPTITQRGRFEQWQCENLTLLYGDFFDLDAADLATCHSVFDRASLVALPTDMRPDYARHLTRILPPTATTLLVTMTYPQQQMQGPPFSVSRQEVERLYRDAYAISLLFSCEILQENPRFRDKGLTELQEQVFLLQPR